MKITGEINENNNFNKSKRQGSGDLHTQLILEWT